MSIGAGFPLHLTPEQQQQLVKDIFGESLILRIMRRYQRQRFRVAREVHARRARKLRRRGEDVHFERWEHGHCIYSWGGPTPTTFNFRRMPLSIEERCAYTPIVIGYRPRLQLKQSA